MFKFLSRLNQPFPDKDSFKESIKGLIGVSVFISLFLFIIRPFGISGASQQLLLVCLGFGAITFVCGLLYDVLIRFVLKIKTDEDSWTLAKWVLQGIGLLLFIAIGNYLFLVFLSEGKWSHYSLPTMCLYTAVVGVFPLLFSGLKKQIKAIKSNQQIADSMDLGGKNLSKLEKNPSELVHIADQEFIIRDILFVEAQQNYLSICYWQDRRLKKELLRATLKELESALKGDVLLKCHRSYFVNIDRVKKVEGNAQGLRISLDNFEEKQIPVSRTFIEKVRNSLCI